MHCLLTSTVSFLGDQTDEQWQRGQTDPYHRALLYLKHPYHLADCIRAEPVLPFASSSPQVQGQFLCWLSQKAARIR